MPPTKESGSDQVRWDNVNAPTLRKRLREVEAERDALREALEKIAGEFPYATRQARVLIEMAHAALERPK